VVNRRCTYRERISNAKSASRHQSIGQHKRVLYEQVTGVKVLFAFSFIGLLLLFLLSLRFMLLSTGFVFALWMSRS
jgi:hypothetical protein